MQGKDPADTLDRMYSGCIVSLCIIILQAKRLQPGAAQAGAGRASGSGKRRRAGTGRAPPVAAAKHWRAMVHRSGAIMHLVRFFRWRTAVRAIVLHSSCTGWLPRSYRRLGPGHKAICRSWKVPRAPSSPRAGSARARHDDPSARPHDPPRPPLSQRSFLWPKRLTAGVAAAKGGPGGAGGPAGVVGATVTISNYVTQPRYARPNRPHRGNRAISRG